MAEMWTKLAADLESVQALLQTICEGIEDGTVSVNTLRVRR
jgi:hypothetical protein